MSTPNIEGYTGSTPYDHVKILDTIDSRAFLIGYVAPGGNAINYNAFWYNFGYSYFVDGQLSLVAHTTLDAGTSADTTDVMALTAKVADILGMGVAATPANTAGWTIPLPSPFRPFIDSFQCGIKWSPSIGASIGIIRKAFQWDGSYNPDTWDFIYYPVSNGYTPDSVYLTDPMTLALYGATHYVEVDVDCSTGYRLYIWGGVLSFAVLYKHYQDGDPWHDSVNNATGYVINLRFMSMPAPNYPMTIRAKDGSYDFELQIEAGKISFSLGTVGGGFYEYDTTAAYSTVSLRVSGTEIKVYVGPTLRITETLNVSSTAKILEWGGHCPGAGGHFKWKIDHIKYFLNGNTLPAT